MGKLLRNRMCRQGGRTSHPAQQVKELEEWFESPLGQHLISSEQQTLSGHLCETAGYRAMLLKVAHSSFSVESAPQLHKFTLAPHGGAGVATLADMDALPMPSDVVELGVLHHVLDFTEYPHEALNEASRVVQSAGQLIIVGYNPWSLFGLWRLFGRVFTCRAIWRSRCLSVSRVTDWLKLVGFQPEKVSYGAHRPPLKSARVLAKLGFLDRLGERFKLPMGNYYIITARKIRVRPIGGKKEWLARAMKPVKLVSRTQIKK